MRSALVLLLVLSGAARAEEPCRFVSITLPGEDPPKPAACDGADIEIARACHCEAKGEWRPWGSSQGFRLEMARTARVVSGGRVQIPVTLRYQGVAPLEADFLGGDVAYQTDAWRGKKKVATAPCGELTTLPPNVRLMLRPGAVVRGTASWKASTSQLDSCDLAEDLRPGRYRVEFTAISGEPALTTSVIVTVVRRR